MSATGGFRVGPDSHPDRYVLGPAVASGAEGILYRASITTTGGLELEVAIKMLQPRFLPRVEEWHDRWSEQVELLRSLQVPGVVRVRDGFMGPLPHPPGEAGESQSLYLVMNWVEGESLDEWVRRRPERDPFDALKLLLPVAAALDLMHSGRAMGGVPVVHRDVKPSNIIITDEGSVLVDFGLTRGLPTGQRLSGVAGTAGYLAPEATEAGIYSPATDRYALGAVAYFIFTGSEPPPSHQPEALRTGLDATPALAGRPDVVGHIMKMLDDDPGDRPEGLANWVGQLRRSSLAAFPLALAPEAPARHPPPMVRDDGRGQRRRARKISSNGPTPPGHTRKERADSSRPHRFASPGLSLCLVAMILLASGAVYVRATDHWPWREQHAPSRPGDAPSQSGDAPSPVLEQFIPNDWTVVSQQRVFMDDTNDVAQVVLITRGRLLQTGLRDLAPGNVTVLSWNSEAKRWSAVFDAAQAAGPGRLPRAASSLDRAVPNTDDLDAKAVAASDAVLLPQDREPIGLQVLPISTGTGKGHDLAISANMESGMGAPGQRLAILHFDGGVIRPVYTFRSWGPGSIDAVDTSKGQRVRVTTSYYSPIDSHCCPVRKFAFEVERQGERYAGGGERYAVVSDDRPWTGSYVLYDRVDDQRSAVVVASVVPGSPADGKLRPGDMVLGVRGVEAPKGATEPYVLDAVSKSLAGQTIELNIRRGPDALTVPIQLASRLTALTDQSHWPNIPKVGWILSQSDGGPVVSKVLQGEIADKAGLAAGSRILSIGGTTVRSPSEATMALMRGGINADIPVRISDASGATAVIVIHPTNAFTYYEDEATHLTPL